MMWLKSVCFISGYTDQLTPNRTIDSTFTLCTLSMLHSKNLQSTIFILETSFEIEFGDKKNLKINMLLMEMPQNCL